MLSDVIKFLQGQSKVAPVDPDVIRTMITDSNTGFKSLEQYNHCRYRERFAMRTSSIDAFASYVNDRCIVVGKSCVKTAVDSDACVSTAIFNANTKDGDPGHCDDTATCTLKALPMWAFIMSIGEIESRQCEQREVIDIIRDWHDYIPDATNLVQGFTKLSIDALSNRESTERDFGREKTAMEKIDIKSNGGEVPSDIDVKLAPYDGFNSRDVQISVSAKIDRHDCINIRLRVRGYEALKLSIAEEFAEKLDSALTVKPIIGTIEAA